MPPLFWLLDVYIPNLEAYCGTIDFRGKLLTISNQLWSILNGDEVRSMLIGPGFLYGKGEVKGYPINIKEPLIGVITDATELRSNQEIPLIDLMNPELIDPTAEADIEKVIVSIKKVVRSRGKVFLENKLAEVKERGKIPMVVGTNTVTKEINVQTFRGQDKLRFVLGGENNKIYRELVTLIEDNKFSVYRNMQILRSDTKKFTHIDSFIDSNWIIVEKNIDLDEHTKKSFKDEVLEEFNNVISEVDENIDSYILK